MNSHNDISLISTGCTIITFLCAYIVAILCEWPTIAIIKIIFPRAKAKRVADKSKEDNVKDEHIMKQSSHILEKVSSDKLKISNIDVTNGERLSSYKNPSEDEDKNTSDNNAYEKDINEMDVTLL